MTAPTSDSNRQTLPPPPRSMLPEAPASREVGEVLANLARANTPAEAVEALQHAWNTLDDELHQYRPLIDALIERLGEVDRLRNLADPVALTNVGNRRGFRATAERELARHRRNAQPLAIVLLDMDGLKAINDEFGHAAGDEAILAMARESASVLRSSDYLARLGGDELAIVLPETDADGARKVCARIRRAVASREVCGVRLAVSVGAAVGTVPELDELLADADAALYRDKRARKEARGWSTPVPPLTGERTRAA